MIDLPPDQLQTVKAILAAHVPGCEVRVFGSRVNGTARKHSDLDLAVVGPEKLSSEIIEDLREAFQESDLPIRVDVLDWNAVSEPFKKIILGNNPVSLSPQ
jgi:predicted nucleotidyltransferase